MILTQLGDWTIDPMARTISHGRKSSHVSPKAMLVLQALLDASGAVVPRGDLLDAAWPDVTVGEEVLTHAIAELRRAFAQCSGRSAPLRTIYKAGYQLTETVSTPGDGSGHGETLTAFAPYLAARCLSELDDRENAFDAIRLYREALASDPDFPGAHSGLAIKMICCRFCHGAEAGILEHAIEHARLAITLDPSAAEPHLALGHALASVGDWNGAIRSFKTVIRLEPNLPMGYRVLSAVMFRNGAIESASAACDRVAALLPDESTYLLLGARARRAMGDEAGSAARITKARTRVERRLQEEPDDLRAKCQKFSCLVEGGEGKEALEWGAPMLGTAHSVTNTMVGSLARLGEIDLALNQLEAAIEGGWNDRGLLAHDPDIAALRREPRFDRIAAHLH